SSVARRCVHASVKFNASHVSAMELPLHLEITIEVVRCGRARLRDDSALCRGRSSVRVLPSERLLPNGHEGASTPLADSGSEQPPVIRRAELVAFALVALLVITV